MESTWEGRRQAWVVPGSEGMCWRSCDSELWWTWEKPQWFWLSYWCSIWVRACFLLGEMRCSSGSAAASNASVSVQGLVITGKAMSCPFQGCREKNQMVQDIVLLTLGVPSVLSPFPNWQNWDFTLLTALKDLCLKIRQPLNCPLLLQRCARATINELLNWFSFILKKLFSSCKSGRLFNAV